MQAVCSGFVYALATADQFMRSGQYRHALVVGAEIYSRILDWKDRGTCVLFGDGAGAVVLSAQRRRRASWRRDLHADGSLCRTFCACRAASSGGQVAGRPLLQMDGSAVFKFAVKVLGEVVGRDAGGERARRKADIDWLVPHQANIRIIQATAKKLGLEHGEASC